MNRGFTLFELVVVMSFVAIVGGFTMLMSIDTYRSYNFYTERDLVIASLHHARALSVGNTCTGATCTTGKPHGVSVQADKYVIFQGATYATRDVSEDATIQAHTVVTHSGLSEVIFAQLSGNSVTPGIITFIQGDRSTNITIGAQGQIFWDK